MARGTLLKQQGISAAPASASAAVAVTSENPPSLLLRLRSDTGNAAAPLAIEVTPPASPVIEVTPPPPLPTALLDTVPPHGRSAGTARFAEPPASHEAPVVIAASPSRHSLCSVIRRRAASA